MSTRDELLLQEVGELTELLRLDPKWEHLREAVRSKGLPIETVLLAGFHEDEHRGQYGAIVTTDGRVLEFEWCAKPGERGLKVWREVKEWTGLETYFPALGAAMRIVSRA